MNRPRSRVAVVVGIAAAGLVGFALLTGGDRGGQPSTTADGDPSRTRSATDHGEADVVALREPPWLSQEVDVLAVVTASDGRIWTVDLAAGSVAGRRVDQAAPSFVPVDAVVDGHLVSHWDGTVHAVPFDGGEPRELAVAADRIPRPITFRSERPDAVWIVQPAPTGADGDEVVVSEHTVDGEHLRTAATTFPLFAAPVAAGGGGLLAHGLGHDVADLELVDIATGARRHLLEIPIGGQLLAARGGTAVVSGPPCTPGCTLTILDLVTGSQRSVPAPDEAGVRTAPGSISPDESTLVHGVSTTVADDPHHRYVVTDLVAATSRLSDVRVGPGVAWSTDGSAFVAAPGRRGGGDTRLVVHRVATGETDELPVLIRIPRRSPWALGG